jgi:glycosyltransferase involved in cell wall biosynthesis
MNDKVSVIITSYNSNEDYLKSAIDSVLNQTYNNIELILVDDGSTNGVCKNIYDQYGVLRIKYIRQDNKGIAAARNTGLKNTTGNYICFLDDDDIWCANKVAEQLMKFHQVEKFDSSIGIVFSYCNVIDEEGEKIGEFGFKVRGNIHYYVVAENVMGQTSSLMIRKEVLDEVGLFNENYRYAEDIELWYRMTKKFTAYSIDYPLVNYRYRKNSLSKNIKLMADSSERALLQALESDTDPNIINHRSLILSRHYINTAYAYFSANEPALYRRTLFKASKIDLACLLSLKVLFGYVVSLFGKGFMTFINKIRNRENRLPIPLMTIREINNNL